MPLRLIPPGRRKDRPFIVARGTVAGRRVEVSTRTTDPRAARRFADEFERRILEGRVPRPGETVDFATAAKHYLAARPHLSTTDRRYVDRLVGQFGPRLVGDIVQADLVAAADALYPGRSAATRNRSVIRPAAAIVAYASENRWCGLRRFAGFQEEEPPPRAAPVDVFELLYANTEGHKRLLIALLYERGQRLSDNLRIKDEQLDLPQGRITLRIGKTRRWRTFGLSPDLVALLASTPRCGPEQYLFPWRHRAGVYKWLKPLCRKLGLHFTPHMARHALATDMLNDGADEKRVMAAGGWASLNSMMRYRALTHSQATDSGRQAGQLRGKK